MLGVCRGVGGSVPGWKQSPAQETVEIALYGFGGGGPCQNIGVHYSGLFKVNDFSSFMAMSSLLRQANIISSPTGDHQQASWVYWEKWYTGFSLCSPGDTLSGLDKNGALQEDDLHEFARLQWRRFLQPDWLTKKKPRWCLEQHVCVCAWQNTAAEASTDPASTHPLCPSWILQCSMGSCRSLFGPSHTSTTDKVILNLEFDVSQWSRIWWCALCGPGLNGIPHLFYHTLSALHFAILLCLHFMMVIWFPSSWMFSISKMSRGRRG